MALRKLQVSRSLLETFFDLKRATTLFCFIADKLLHLARYQHIESLEQKSRPINLVAEQFDITHILA